MSDDPFGFDGRRVVVLGGATGMGAATATMAKGLGATTIVLDIAEIGYPCDQAIHVDLSDRASIDAALDQIEGPVDALFACAGIADGPPIMRINFIGQRYVLDALIESGRLARGGSVTFISSVAGLGFMQNLERTQTFLAADGWDGAVQWLDDNPDCNHYGFSKEAINAFVGGAAFPLLQQGIRVNAIMPGPTDTPLARANEDMWLGFGAGYREAAGVELLQPEQMAATMLFLASDAASGVNGVTLLVDQGHVNASLVGGFEEPIVRMLAGLEEFDISALG